MADLAALRRADAAGFAGGERRHVVVHHEIFGELAGQCIDALRVAGSAERGGDQRLRFAAGEQRRAMGTRQHAAADLDLAHGARIAAVDARLAIQDLAAHDARFDVEQHVVQADLVEDHAVALQRGCGRGRHGAGGVGAGLLRADLVGLAQRSLGECGDLGDERLVLRRGHPVPGRLAGVAHQLVDRVDRDVALLVTEHDAAEHDLFGKLLRLGLDHQHGRLGAGDDQVHLRFEQLGLARVQHVPAVDVADARGADRAVERNARDRQRRRRADQRSDVGRDFRVQRQHVHDDLDLVVETFGEQRAQRPVDQARSQRLEFARAAFALEEATRDLAGRIGLLDVVDRQREEVLARLRVLRGDDGRQHHGVLDVDDDRAARLAGNFTGLQDDGVLTPLEGLGDFVEHAHACGSGCGVASDPEHGTSGGMPFQRCSGTETSVE